MPHSSKNLVASEPKYKNTESDANRTHTLQMLSAREKQLTASVLNPNANTAAVQLAGLGALPFIG